MPSTPHLSPAHYAFLDWLDRHGGVRVRKRTWPPEITHLPRQFRQRLVGPLWVDHPELFERVTPYDPYAWRLSAHGRDVVQRWRHKKTATPSR